MLRNYINADENREANKALPRLMFEGLLLGGSGLGVLALIFEIAADAFSVAAYQTLLAIYGAEGFHEIAILAFIVLSVLLFLGIVPAYKAGAYLRPNAGGSGPLVEAIGPEKMRWLSWIGTSLFFLDAVLTIIISSVSAADVLMLIFPEFSAYRIVIAEFFAFFIMSLLVAVGPKRAVPVFLIGGGAFTLFTIGALGMVGVTAIGNPQWAFLTEGIVSRLETAGVVEHVVRAQQDISAIGTVVFFQLFFRSMSSAMLGFSGYEVIPASGKHAARPKWKVINTALTLAAIFLIGTGVVQLYAAQRWNIPATEGYSTLLIEYEIVAVEVFGDGIDESEIVATDEDRLAAEELIAARLLEQAESGEALSLDPEEVAYNLAFARALRNATAGNGSTFLFVAGVLLTIILLLAQGGGYVGGAAVAANAARLGRLPGFFQDDRLGIIVIWAVSAILIPIIREVVVVEAYYAFGFVSAFVITSTTVFFVRKDVLISRGIEPGSGEARSLRFAGLRGMIASYFMLVVLVTTKTDALVAIVLAGTALTLFQIWMAFGGLKRPDEAKLALQPVSGKYPDYEIGLQRAYDQARQRGIADAIKDMLEKGELGRFNVNPIRIIRLVRYLHDVDEQYFSSDGHHDEHIEEPSLELEAVYRNAYDDRESLLNDIEYYSHYGIFTFISNYHLNWVNPECGRDEETVLRAMLGILFPLSEMEDMWGHWCKFEPQRLPEPIWQFSRDRYRWAKDQWPNLSDRITTIWTLQDFGLVPSDIDVTTMVSVVDGRRFVHVKVHSGPNTQPYSTVEKDEAVETNGEPTPEPNEEPADE